MRAECMTLNKKSAHPELYIMNDGTHDNINNPAQTVNGPGTVLIADSADRTNHLHAND
jgi:hypothetical protein